MQIEEIGFKQLYLMIKSFIRKHYMFFITLSGGSIGLALAKIVLYIFDFVTGTTICIVIVAGLLMLVMYRRNIRIRRYRK